MKKGFTLVELMIIIAVMGILAAIAVPSFYAARKQVKNEQWMLPVGRTITVPGTSQKGIIIKHLEARTDKPRYEVMFANGKEGVTIKLSAHLVKMSEDKDSQADGFKPADGSGDSTRSDNDYRWE